MTDAAVIPEPVDLIESLFDEPSINASSPDPETSLSPDPFSSPIFEVTAVRVLSPEDLDELREYNPPHSGYNGHVVRNLKHAHHEVARLMACGTRDVEIHRLTGYSQPHISNLRNSPAFMDLVMYYEGPRDQSAMDIRERLKFVASDALDALHEKVQQEDIAIKELTAMTMNLLDRTGHSPVSRSESRHLHAHVGLSKDEISKIKETAAEAPALLDVTPEPEPDD